MKSILIIPYSRTLPNKIENPKNYSKWQDLINLLINDNFKVYQLVFGQDEPTFNNVEMLCNYDEDKQYNILLQVNCWISVDSYFQHFAKYYNIPGVVIWTLSNPTIYGYPENMNLFSNSNFFIKEEDMYLDWVSISNKYVDTIKNLKHLDPTFIFNKIKEFILKNN